MTDAPITRRTEINVLGKVMSFGKFATSLAAFAALGGGILMQFGFSLITPRQMYASKEFVREQMDTLKKEVRLSIDSVKDQIDSVRAQVSGADTKLSFLVAVQCLDGDPQKRRELLLMRISCEGLLNAKGYP